MWMKILESFIDKVLFGGIVVLIGYLVSITLEKLKYKLSILSELSKKRVEKISESCEAFSLFEERLDQLMEGLTIKENVLDDVTQKVLDMKHETFEKLEKNRFWLGQQLTDVYRKRMKLISELVLALNNNDTNKINMIRTELDDKQIDIDKFIKKYVA
jgi:hypothetical protein